MYRNLLGGMLLAALLTLFLLGPGAKDALAAVAVFDAFGRLTNPEEMFRHNNPPSREREKGRKNAPIPPIPEADAYDESGFPPLMRAVSANDKAEVTRLLQRKANPNVHNVYGRTPLEAAADKGNLEIAALLIKHGAKARLGYPLHYAATAETNGAAMTALLQKHGATEKGAPPRIYHPRLARRDDGRILEGILAEEEKSGMPQPSVPVAVLLGRSQEEIAALLARGSDINEDHPTFGSALHQVLYQKHDTELFAFLLRSGADPNRASIYDQAGYRRRYAAPPLDEALYTGREELVCLLLTSGATFKAPDAKPEQALFHKVVSKGMVEAARLMLKAGADPNEYMRDAKGKPTEPPIFMTASPEMLRLLLASGADPKAEDQKGHNALGALSWRSGNTPAALALLEGGVSGTHSSIGNMVHWALAVDSHELFLAAREAGVSVTERDEKKRTPLLKAVEKGNAWFVRELLKAGASINGSATYFGQFYADEDSFYAGTDDLLAQAVLSKNLEVVEILLKAGVSLNTRSNTYFRGTALHLAIEAERQDMVAALLKAGARTGVTDGYGETPLHTAVDEDNAAIVELLLKAGADPKAKDKDGYTPLDSAEAYDRDPKIIRLLQKR